MFDHERLEVFEIALRFDRLVTSLFPPRGARILKDQTDRASGSVVACIAEGAGRRAPAEKRHFYAIARGSATECAALLELLRNRVEIPPDKYRECRALLLSVVRILSVLSAPPPTPSESAPASEPHPPPSPNPPKR